MNQVHGNIRIKAVKVLRPYVIEVVFHEGTETIIDMEPILHGKMYGPLEDEDLFRKVQVNQEIGTIEWPNGADFDPETLYNWEKYKEDWARKAQSWDLRQQI